MTKNAVTLLHIGYICLSLHKVKTKANNTMTLKELQTYAEDMSKEYPDLAEKITDIFINAWYEIAEGKPPRHECEWAYCNIRDAIEDFLDQ